MTTEYRTQWGIYALRDPRTNRVMYVGQSVDIERRYREHCDTRCFQTVKKSNWLYELYHLGTPPVLEVLEELPRWSDMDACEVKWIKHFQQSGQAELNQQACTKMQRASGDNWLDLIRTLRQIQTLIVQAADQKEAICGISVNFQIGKLSQGIAAVKNIMDKHLYKILPREQADYYSRILYGGKEKDEA